MEHDPQSAIDVVRPEVAELPKGVRARLEEFIQRLMGSSFHERLSRVPTRLGSSGVDPFGFDPEVAKYALMVAAFFHRVWFRTEVSGIDNVPAGRVLAVCNHSGQLPFDATVIAAALFLDAEPPRFARTMVEKWTQTVPFVGTFYARCGQVLGVPENARLLLQNEELVLVFPEGVRGIAKPITRRYELTDFGLGFARLALQTKTPILPMALVGAEEQYISVGNLGALAKMLSMPVFPMIPQLLLPGGQMPLPVKYRLYVGQPLTLEGDPDDDDAVIEQKVFQVREQVEALIQRGLRERRGLFW